MSEIGMTDLDNGLARNSCEPSVLNPENDFSGGGLRKEIPDSPGPDRDSGASGPVRLAGAIFIVMAIVNLIGFALGIGREDPLNPIGPSVVDLWVGTSLLRGSVRTLGFAKFRVIAGAILFGGLFAVQGNFIGVVVQLVFSLALCALLFGRAGKLRIRTAIAVSVLVLFLNLLGFQQILTGHNSLTTVVQRFKLRPRKLGSDAVRGLNAPYSIGPLPDDWGLLDTERARKMNPVVDRWFIDSVHDAGIQVISETVSASEIPDLDSFQKAVVANMSGGVEGLKTFGEQNLTLHGQLVRVFDITGKVQSLDLHYRYGLFLQDGLAIQVIGVSSQKAFSVIKGDIQAAIESLIIERSIDLPVSESVPNGAAVV